MTEETKVGRKQSINKEKVPNRLVKFNKRVYNKNKKIEKDNQVMYLKSNLSKNNNNMLNMLLRINNQKRLIIVKCHRE